MIVVDASALVKVLVEGGTSGDAVSNRLRGEAVSAPSLIDAEVLAALRRLTLTGRLAEERARVALDLLGRARILRAPLTGHLPRAWHLRTTVGAYDAMYVALAEALRCPLITADARLSRAAGIRCQVEAFP
jgi:predicted nucleic acid-binding protein